MDRNYRLAICQQCKIRGFHPNKGIVCSLTNEHATFERSCPDYEEDSKAKAHFERLKAARAADDLYHETGGFSKFGITNGFAIGFIVLILGLLWLVLGWIFLERIFIYPFLLIGYGLYKMIRSGIVRAEKKRGIQNERDLLDNEVKW